MDDFRNEPFDYNEYPDSPPQEVSRAMIKLAVPELAYAEPKVTLLFRATFQVSLDMSNRYRRLGDALALVIHDVDQRSAVSVRTFNSFITYSEEDSGPNQLAEPPLPFPGRGDPYAAVPAGGWVSTQVTFSTPRPRTRPSVYLYLVLENYVSNVVGLDLLEPRVIVY